MGEGALDEELGVVVVVGSPTGLAPPPPHPTAKASTAAPPNSAIAVLAPDFIKCSILMSGRFVHTRVHFIVGSSGDAVIGFGDNPAVSLLWALTVRQ